MHKSDKNRMLLMYPSDTSGDDRFTSYATLCVCPPSLCSVETTVHCA